MLVIAVSAVALFAAGVGASTSLASQTGSDHHVAGLHASCSSGFVDAIIAGEDKCLHAGEFCSPASETDYERYGFMCVGGRLQSGVATPPPSSTTAETTTAVPTTPASTTAPALTTSTAQQPRTTTTLSPGAALDIGHTVLLKTQTKTSGCTLGPLPDRRCSPGAYYSGLTKAVICSASFHTSLVRNVPDSEKHQVEIEYGLVPKGYGSSLEIDHLVSLELGGSNDSANLFPEKVTFAAHAPGFHAKDKLENKVHDLVCSGQMTLNAARSEIAMNWETLYKRVYGVVPTG